MTLSYSLSRIIVDKFNPYQIIPISFDLQTELEVKYYIHTRFAAQKVGITVGKVHGHNEPLIPHMKPEKEAKILSKLSNGTTMNQSQSQILPSEEDRFKKESIRYTSITES